MRVARLQSSAFSPYYPLNRTAIVNIGISALNGFIRDHVGHQHSALEVDGIRARRNAYGFKFAPPAVITDTAGVPLGGDEMQLPAPLAHDPIPRWHAAIMLRPTRAVSGLVQIPFYSLTPAPGEQKAQTCAIACYQELTSVSPSSI